MAARIFCEALPAGEELPANVLSDSGGTVQAQRETGLESVLGALDLDRRGCNVHVDILVEHKVDEVVLVGRVLGNEVKAQRPISE